MFGIGKKIQKEKNKLFNFLLIKIGEFFPNLHNQLKLKIEKKNFKKILYRKLIRLETSNSSDTINSYEF